MARAVFFADIFGFSNLASAVQAEGAVDALSDLSHLLSSQDELATLLRREIWEERYALSDSIFLVTANPVEACRVAAEIFFHLAYLNHSTKAPVLLRGGIATGEAFKVASVFPEFSSSNLVGEAVVRAVKLEAHRRKGPRLFVDPATAEVMARAPGPEKWLLIYDSDGGAEILWLLPGEPATSNGGLIGEVCETAFRLAEQNARHPTYGQHYLGYLELVTSTLERLLDRVPREGGAAVTHSKLTDWLPRLNAALAECSGADEILVRLDALPR